MDWTIGGTILAAMFAMFGGFSGLMVWLMSRLETRIHNDIGALSSRIDGAHTRIDAMGARIEAMGARIEAMGTRIDTTQGIIMRMLEKQGR